MKLTKVQIRNFRSIRYANLPLDPTCRILVGINESGKSNVLKALAYLAPDLTLDKSEIRVERTDEARLTNSEIYFVFKLDPEETKGMHAATKDSLFTEFEGAPIVQEIKGKRELSFEELCQSKDEALYVVDFLKQERRQSHWAIEATFKILPNWKTPTAIVPVDFNALSHDLQSIKLRDFKLIDANSISSVPSGYLEPAKISDINILFNSEMKRLLADQIPVCIFWNYNESNHLPPRVNLDEFIANPNICVPLKHMFGLAGISDIAAEIARKRAQAPHALRALLVKVSRVTTQYIREVWQEYRSISVQVSQNGLDIDIAVLEETKSEIFDSTPFDFASRSDGFKRFISFLLTLAARVKSKNLTNALLIIDEPETGLHPSGAKHLLSELLNMSRDNHVVFSTHSIHMVDGDALERHVIVKKTDEITSLTSAETSNILDEEVLFQAMGYSIFETLKKRNIIFEGWRDKRLFQIAMTKLSKESKNLKKKLDEIGICHARGVKDIKNVAAFLELAKRPCLILSDEDGPSKEKQREYLDNHGWGKWLRYSEIIAASTAVTGEDFVKTEAFHKPIEKLRAQFPALAELPDQMLTAAGGKVRAIDQWLRAGGLDDEARKAGLSEIKSHIFEKLKTSQIEAQYFEIAASLLEDGCWNH